MWPCTTHTTFVKNLTVQTRKLEHLFQGYCGGPSFSPVPHWHVSCCFPLWATSCNYLLIASTRRIFKMNTCEFEVIICGILGLNFTACSLSNMRIICYNSICLRKCHWKDKLTKYELCPAVNYIVETNGAQRRWDRTPLSVHCLCSMSKISQISHFKIIKRFQLFTLNINIDRHIIILPFLGGGWG